MTARQKPAVTPLLLSVLVAISALQPFAINVLAPSTPGLARSFSTDYATIQLTLTLYLLAVAISQLIVGPISDRIGRRPCILAGIALFALGSLIGALATRIEILLAARIVQAIGGGTCFALCRAVIRDSATRDQSTSLIGYLTSAMVVAPMIAPMVGGFLDAHFGWRSIFLACAIMAVIVAAPAFALLRETARRREASAIGILAAYPILLRNRAFVGYAIVLSTTSATFFGLVAGAPHIVIEHMGRTPDVYGTYFVAQAGGYMIGNFLSGRLGQRVGSDRLVRIGILLSIAGVLLEVIVAASLPWTPATLFLPLMLNAVGNGLTIPGATASALSIRPELAGTAAGLSGAAQLGVGALSAVLMGIVVPAWPYALVAGMLLCVLVAWVAHHGLVRR